MTGPSPSTDLSTEMARVAEAQALTAVELRAIALNGFRQGFGPPDFERAAGDADRASSAAAAIADGDAQQGRDVHGSAATQSGLRSPSRAAAAAASVTPVSTRITESPPAGRPASSASRKSR